MHLQKPVLQIDYFFKPLQMMPIIADMTKSRLNPAPPSGFTAFDTFFQKASAGVQNQSETGGLFL